MKYVPTNREKKLAPRGRSFWCGACDANMIHAGSKCENCGSRTLSKRRMKFNKRNAHPDMEH